MNTELTFAIKFKRLFWERFLYRLPEFRFSVSSWNGKFKVSNKDLIGYLLFVNRNYEKSIIEDALNAIKTYAPHFLNKSIVLDIKYRYDFDCLT